MGLRSIVHAGDKRLSYRLTPMLFAFSEASKSIQSAKKVWFWPNSEEVPLSATE